MQFRYGLELIAGIAVLSFCLLFYLAGPIAGEEGYAGSDARASEEIAEMTGRSAEEFRPLVPQWTPPGKEIESGLFALQAAVGGIIVGLIFGSWRCQKKRRSSE